MKTVPVAAAILMVAIVASQFLFPNAAVQTVDLFLEAVQQHEPKRVASLFCRDGVLLGTVSQIQRKGEDIERYFNYFAKLPNIHVLSKQHNVSRIEPDVQINNAVVTWTWDGLEKPVVARMTFVVKNSCIFELHSSELPHENEKLFHVSHKY